MNFIQLIQSNSDPYSQTTNAPSIGYHMKQLQKMQIQGTFRSQTNYRQTQSLRLPQNQINMYKIKEQTQVNVYRSTSQKNSTLSDLQKQMPITFSKLQKQKEITPSEQQKQKQISVFRQSISSNFFNQQTSNSIEQQLQQQKSSQNESIKTSQYGNDLRQEYFMQWINYHYKEIVVYHKDRAEEKVLKRIKTKSEYTSTQFNDDQCDLQEVDSVATYSKRRSCYPQDIENYPYVIESSSSDSQELIQRQSSTINSILSFQNRGRINSF